MTKIADLLSAGRTLSFEFGPPRDDEGRKRLDKTLLELEPLQPSFVSVTYGAGGSTRDQTREIVEHVARDTAMIPMPHLTCVGHTRAQLTQIVAGYRDIGLENLLALAGDPPGDGSPVATDFRYAAELIALARQLGDFSVGVAAFPEVHPRSPDRAADRRQLAAKLEAADFAITQFFFDSAHYFGLVDDLRALGVEKPVIPGVMLFVNVDGLRRMSAMNNATIPAELDHRLDAVSGRPGAVRALAVEVATQLVSELLDGGAPGVHLYTMNYPRATLEVCANLGLAPEAR